MFLYDVTDKNTFLNLGDWFKGTMEDYKIKPSIIVGTKTDLIEKRQINYSDFEKLLPETSTMYNNELSSKDNVNVDETFYRFTKILLANVYPFLTDYIDLPEIWEPSNHKLFPPLFKTSVFVFLICSKKLGDIHKFKVPKYVNFEIFKHYFALSSEEIHQNISQTLKIEKDKNYKKYEEELNKNKTTGYCNIY